MIRKACLNAARIASTSSRRAAPRVSHLSTSKSAPMTGEEIIRSCKKYTMWSWSAQQSVDPICMTRAKGIYFWDDKDKRYTDFNSQLMCTNVGHQHPKIIQAIKDQAEELCFAGPAVATRARAELGPLLAKQTPGDLNKFFFALGGAEANENAIRLARMHTGRSKIITRYRSYHGATFATISMTGDARRFAAEAGGGGMNGVVRVFDPYMYRSQLYRDGMSEEEFSAAMVDQLEETILYENPDNIAAMFLETVTGTNGIIPPPTGYLSGVRSVLSKYGIMMVCDEVMCGMGRTGEWFACDHWEVVPDMVTIAKGITSAMVPLGVVAMKPEVFHSFDKKPYVGGLTYSGHPLSLAAACATIKVMEEEKIVDNAKAMGVHLSDNLQAMKAKHPCVGDARSIGLFGAFELVKDRRTKKPMPAAVMAEVGKFLRANGVFVYINGCILHTNPPLVITKEQIEETFVIIDKALEIADGVSTSS